MGTLKRPWLRPRDGSKPVQSSRWVILQVIENLASDVHGPDDQPGRFFCDPVLETMSTLLKAFASYQAIMFGLGLLVLLWYVISDKRTQPDDAHARAANREERWKF